VGAQILSVGCGHCRELELCSATAVNTIKRFAAIDHDPSVLNLLHTFNHGLGKILDGRCLSVRDILKAHPLGKFDLIYCTGLYDYLSQRTAERLTAKLFQYLQSGASLLIGNFLEGPWEGSYMEAYMDWHLNYRSPKQIQDFSREVQSNEIEKQEYWADPRIGYLKITRK
jgi:extracellular factor (EF) 3-hydroxypalmitic acid methyl ester biosynthesis protein